jgi:hypothetical protein
MRSSVSLTTYDYYEACRGMGLGILQQILLLLALSMTYDYNLLCALSMRL